MRKTGLQVEKDIFSIVKASALASAVSGGVYRDGTRPFNSDKEDIVVAFMTGLAGQIESGTVTVTIHVPDMESGGRKMKNISRLNTLEALADTMVEEQKGGEYRMSLGNTIQSFKSEGIDWHFIDVKIKYKRVSF